jgi:hypothetical protein
VNACRNRCEDEADADADFEDQVDVCENCLDDTSCSEGTFNCATQCSSIVP